MFRGVIQDQHGPDVFVTSVTGEYVRIYPMPVWLEIERKLSQMPATTRRASSFSTASTTTGRRASSTARAAS